MLLYYCFPFYLYIVSVLSLSFFQKSNIIPIGFSATYKREKESHRKLQLFEIFMPCPLCGHEETNIEQPVKALNEIFYQVKAREFCYVLNSRQMGKTRSKVQTIQRLQAKGNRNYQFLAASLALDKRAMQTRLEAKEQDLQVLSETNHKANRWIRLGAIALRVMLMGAIAAGFSACQSTKTGIAVNSDRAVAAVETARRENEHLLKQSASKQNLRVASQKQVVNGVRKQNSLGHNRGVYSVSFSPDGQTIAFIARFDKTIKLWKRDGTPIKRLSGHY